jgi:hypothetical protein
VEREQGDNRSEEMGVTRGGTTKNQQSKVQDSGEGLNKADSKSKMMNQTAQKSR